MSFFRRVLYMLFNEYTGDKKGFSSYLLNSVNKKQELYKINVYKILYHDNLIFI
jgi:hypothetical protein